jgi:demethylmenaquinone methyltransferase/2-methoxy-6-polyprenyl-1,4-benzoquinol methylase
MARVTKSGGRLAILEITPIQSNSLFAKLFRFYFRRIVPWLGVILVGDRETYTYLPESAEGFPDAGLLARIMEEAGWANVTYRRVGMGSVAIHVGKKAG